MTLTNVVASAPTSQFWRDRGAQSWAHVLPIYWEAGGQPHRISMIQALRALPRFESLREVGCCAGTNVRLIREHFPWVSVEGTELSVEAATFAQDKLAKDPHVRIVCTDLYVDAPLWADREIDVTLSVYTLAYVPPERLIDVLGHMIRASTVAVILVEPMHRGPSGRLPVEYTEEWRHDYREAFEAATASDPRPMDINIGTLTTPTESCDGIAIVRFL